MDAFFEHENNHAWPPSLASNGIMHQTSKSDLMECLESMVPKSESVPYVDVKIVDGAALVHILDPNKSLSKFVMTMHSSCTCHIYKFKIERMLQDVVGIYQRSTLALVR